MTHDPNEYARLYQAARESVKLKKKLEIAIKALEYYADQTADKYGADNLVANEALEKIKEE